MLAATVFGGFPLSDIPHTGLSVIITSDGDKAAGDALRDELDALVLHVGQSPEQAEQVYDIAFDGYQLSYRMP